MDEAASSSKQVGEECKGIEFELREYEGSERTQMHVDPLQWWHVNEKKFPMFNVCKTNYRNFPSYFTKFRFLHYSRYLKNTIELKENNDQSTSNLIPNEIEQNLQRWEKALLGNSSDPNLKPIHEYPWMGFSLKCVDVIKSDNNFGYRIILSIENLSQLSSLRQLTLNAGFNLDLKILEPNCDIIVECVFIKSFDNNILIKMGNERFDSFNLVGDIKGKCFDIRYGNNYALNTTINLFGNREELTKQKGYDAMLYAFKCKQMPDYGDDPDISKLMPLHKNYDSSQLTALSALLNKNRPIVAIHGAAGTGKTLLLAQYLDIILKSDEYKNMPIAVISPSTSSLYRIIDFYCSIASKEILKEIPFIIMREFDGAAAFLTLQNPNVQQLVNIASFHNFKRIYSEEVLNIFKEKKFFEKSKDGSSQEISSLIQHMQSLKDKEAYDFIKKRRIVFLTYSPSKFQLLERIGIKFGGVIIDNAERINESESWQTILKTSSFVRLFGDYHQFIKPSSMEQLKLNYNKSLLQKLDEDFGDSNVNFHLNRQYTANSTIRAWGDSVLYKEKKAIPADKSVEEMNLNEILMPNLKNKTPKLITEPLVLVDTSKLEGEWKESMFETEKVDIVAAKYNYQTYRNWGMALISAQHINLLLQNGINPNEIAHPLSSFPHHLIIGKIFGSLWPYNLHKFNRICTQKQRKLCGLHFSVYLRTFLDNQFVFTENDYQSLLTNWNFTLSRANRQFVFICDIKNLENNCFPKMKEMLECFRSTGGIIVGPNDIFPLKNGQFEEIKNLVKKRLKRI
ncbi:hypothetical protein ACQ4LE_010631 [Meloidogyne hapla]